MRKGIALRLDKTDQRFAICRSMGHEWHHGKAIGSDDPDPLGRRRPFGSSTGMVGLPSTCSTCATGRVRWVTRSGEVVTRYDYPDGYSRHGEDRLTPQQWRASYVETLFESFTATADRRRRPRAKAAS